MQPTDTQINEMQQELGWLRYFYSEARHAMGPADSDIYFMIKEEYIEGGRVLPEEYKEEVEEEE